MENIRAAQNYFAANRASKPGPNAYPANRWWGFAAGLICAIFYNSNHKYFEIYFIFCPLS